MRMKLIYRPLLAGLMLASAACSPKGGTGAASDGAMLPQNQSPEPAGNEPTATPTSNEQAASEQASAPTPRSVMGSKLGALLIGDGFDEGVAFALADAGKNAAALRLQGGDAAELMVDEAITFNAAVIAELASQELEPEQQGDVAALLLQANTEAVLELAPSLDGDQAFVDSFGKNASNAIMSAAAGNADGLDLGAVVGGAGEGGAMMFASFDLSAEAQEELAGEQLSFLVGEGLKAFSENEDLAALLPGVFGALTEGFTAGAASFAQDPVAFGQGLIDDAMKPLMGLELPADLFELASGEGLQGFIVGLSAAEGITDDMMADQAGAMLALAMNSFGENGMPADQLVGLAGPMSQHAIHSFEAAGIAGSFVGMALDGVGKDMLAGLEGFVPPDLMLANLSMITEAMFLSFDPSKFEGLDAAAAMGNVLDGMGSGFQAFGFEGEDAANAISYASGGMMSSAEFIVGFDPAHMGDLSGKLTQFSVGLLDNVGITDPELILSYSTAITGGIGTHLSSLAEANFFSADMLGDFFKAQQEYGVAALGEFKTAGFLSDAQLLDGANSFTEESFKNLATAGYDATALAGLREDFGTVASLGQYVSASDLATFQSTIGAYDPAALIAQAETEAGAYEACLPYAQAGTHFYNGVLGTCEAITAPVTSAGCPAGFHESETQECVPDATSSATTSYGCAEGQYYDYAANQCVTPAAMPSFAQCPAGEFKLYQGGTATCVSSCPAGTHVDGTECKSDSGGSTSGGSTTSCPSGYHLEGGTCIQDGSDSTTSSMTCPEGYTGTYPSCTSSSSSASTMCSMTGGTLSAMSSECMCASVSYNPSTHMCSSYQVQPKY